MTDGGTESLLKRRNAPKAVTSSGPIHPQSALPGIGGASLSRSADARERLSGGAASAWDVVIDCHRIGAGR
jgi:hypothetical protein